MLNIKNVLLVASSSMILVACGGGGSSSSSGGSNFAGTKVDSSGDICVVTSNKIEIENGKSCKLGSATSLKYKLQDRRYECEKGAIVTGGVLISSGGSFSQNGLVISCKK